MIEWKEHKGDKGLVDRELYLTTDGQSISFRGYVDGRFVPTSDDDDIENVTHYAEINLPKIKPIAIEDDPNQAKLEL